MATIYGLQFVTDNPFLEEELVQGRIPRHHRGLLETIRRALADVNAAGLHGARVLHHAAGHAVSVEADVAFGAPRTFTYTY